ncbi:MAG: Alkyl hydroperoxide reductase AhpD [uncultured Sulfurovum sp.]|uniref:Alkyl hydroperoxide reductase AhpD n=1 Tax=uncultured Sulfurovum sp. TaxID=269237 RepID=A0A6S6S0V7_9BACT|nr:MAG: Alkyl hydroperoxide reductase AhpD [uncultured Sulfurovum sp.]
MAHITLANYKNMSKSVKEKADQTMKKTGNLGEIFQLLALSDDVFFATDNMASKYLLKETLLPYSTKQRIAILVSLDNGCKMCVGVHKQLARVLGMNEAEIEEIALGIDALSCSNAEKALLHFAIRASKKDNYKILKEDIDLIKAQGYSEEEIFEAVCVVAYFNYINTLSNTFGLGE